MNSSAHQPSPTDSAIRDPGAERKAAETVARLQRGVLRLALAYHGRNPELDKKLKEFGTLIRSGRGQGNRQVLIDEIVDIIVALDLKQENASTPEPANKGVDHLNHFLDSLGVADTLKPEIENTQRLLASAHNRNDALRIIEQAAATLSEHLMHSPDSCRDATSIRMLLLELLERLPLSAALISRASPLRRTIERADRMDIFLECIGTIADLIDELRAELQREIENLGGFLQKTAARLTEFDQFVNRSSEMQSEVANDTLQLSDTIELEIQTLRADVDTSEDIETVRSMISTRLDTIGDGLNTFVSAQNERASQSNKALASMTGKLRELESQTENLRKDLEQQRAQIQVDALTGILNRTGYQETAAKQFARWKRYGGNLSLAVIDLDLFKNINDAYGHAAGDRVLSTVASKLGDHIRECDILCRYGGEEFVLLLPETDAAAAGTLLEKLRSHVAECPFRYKDTPVAVTLSCGVAEFVAGDTLEDVFERADQAMYRAKGEGRNRVFVDAEVSAVAQAV